MEKQKLSNRLKNISYDIRCVEEIISHLQALDTIDNHALYRELSYDAAIRSEYITKKLRTFVSSELFIIGKNESYLSDAASALDITVKDVDGIIEIEFPSFIPKKKKQSTDFITEPLFEVLRQFVNKKTPRFRKFKKCVMCFTHVYDHSFMNKQRIRDHDNIEIHSIINTISLFLLIDDSGLLCSNYNSSELSDRDFTRISIMEMDRFPEWLNSRKDKAQIISQN